MLNLGWELKREVAAGITNPQLDEMHDLGCKAGAFGGKLLGAGGGGFMLFCVPPERRDAVARALHEYRQIPFLFNWTGTTIVFYTPPK
jgi:D-glycero-alpha-D-manno-heptose-7-phosphate kinase